MNQIRYAEGYPRFALAGSLGDHFLFENVLGVGVQICDPCKTNTEMAISSRSLRFQMQNQGNRRKPIVIHRKSIEIQGKQLKSKDIN